MTPRAVNKVIPPSTSDEDLEANHREDTVERYESTILPASAIDFDPEPHKRLFRQFANPAPLGLCAFALTTFLLSLINVQARSVTVPNVLLGVGTLTVILLLTRSFGIRRVCTIYGRYVGVCLWKYIWCSCIFVFWWLLD
jgi:hypothetical protein